MSSMSLKYKKVLLLGATSGIGKALAAKFVETGTSVIAVGRRQDKLDEFAQQYGSKGSVDTAAFDITHLDKIPGFAADMFKKHPDIDCLFLNSGLQRQIDWSKPESVDLDKIDLEWRTNYLSYMHLSKAFLPYLMKKAPQETSIVFTTSGLALVPITGCPNYCATKAALHHMILAMRQQLKEANSNVKIIELYPPAVQTELHDEKHQPELGDKGKHIGMPLDEFTNEAFEGLCKEDNEQVPVQMVKTFMGFNSWEQERQKAFYQMNEFVKKNH